MIFVRINMLHISRVFVISLVKGDNMTEVFKLLNKLKTRTDNDNL